MNTNREEYHTTDENLYGIYRDPFSCTPYTKITWYQGTNQCLCPSIARTMESYEKILKKFSCKVKAQSCVCTNQKQKLCCGDHDSRYLVSGPKQDIAKLSTYINVCLSSSNLPFYKDTPKDATPNVTGKKSCKCHRITDSNKIAPKAHTTTDDNSSSSDLFYNNPKKTLSFQRNNTLATEIPTPLSNIAQIDMDPDDLTEDNNQNLHNIPQNPLQLDATCLECEGAESNPVRLGTSNEEKQTTKCAKSKKCININIEVKVKKKKKKKKKMCCKHPKQERKEEKSIPDKNMEIRSCICYHRPLTEHTINRMCIHSEPNDTVNCQQRQRPSAFVKLIQFCKKIKFGSPKSYQDNVFVNTNQPLKPNQLSKIVKDMDDLAKKSASDLSYPLSDDDEVSVLRIQKVLKPCGLAIPKQTCNKMTYHYSLIQHKKGITNDKKETVEEPNKISGEENRRKSDRTESTLKYSHQTTEKGKARAEQRSTNKGGQDSQLETNPTKHVDLSQIPNQKAQNRQSLLKHVDSQVISKARRTSKGTMNDNNKNNEPPGENILHKLSRHSSKSSRTRSHVKLTISECPTTAQPLIVINNVSDSVSFSRIQPNQVYFRITSRIIDISNTNKIIDRIFMKVMCESLDKCHGVEKQRKEELRIDFRKYYDLDSIFKAFDLHKMENKQQQIFNSTPVQRIYHAHLRRNRYLIKKGKLEITYNGFMNFLIIFFHLIYLLLFVYFTLY